MDMGVLTHARVTVCRLPSRATAHREAGSHAERTRVQTDEAGAGIVCVRTGMVP